MEVSNFILFAIFSFFMFAIDFAVGMELYYLLMHSFAMIGVSFFK